MILPDSVLLDDIWFAGRRALDRGLAPATVAATVGEAFVAFTQAAGDDIENGADLVTAFVDTVADVVNRRAAAIAAGEPEPVPERDPLAPVRFHGGEAWRELGQERRRRIGSLALELVVAWHGIDGTGLGSPEAEPFERAERAAVEHLVDAVLEALRIAPGDRPTVPSLAGAVARLVVDNGESAA